MAFELPKILMDNIGYIVIVGIAIFVIYFILKGRKQIFKPVNRSEIERENFIKRNSKNKTGFKWLYRGNKLIGQIRTMNENIVLKDNPNKIIVNEFVIKPMFWDRLKIPNFFAKEECLMVDNNKCYRNFEEEPSIRINSQTLFNKLFGIFYDVDLQDNLTEHILNDTIMKTDLENMASVYYRHSMEQATFQPNNAILTQSKQLDLEAEKEKRKHLVS